MSKFLTLFSVAMVFIGVSSSPLYAQGQGPFPTHNCGENQEQSLQTRINNLPAGATLFIGGNCIVSLFIDKDINLIGFRSTRTTLSAPPGAHAVVDINNARVEIRRLDIDAAGVSGAGVVAHLGSDLTLRDVVVKNGGQAVFLNGSSSGDIFDSAFINNVDGMTVRQSSYAGITQTTFDGGNLPGGICLRVDQLSSVTLDSFEDRNTIKNCFLGLNTRDGFVSLNGTTFENNTIDVECGPGGVIDAEEPQIIADPPAVVDIQPECRVDNPLF